MLLSPNVGNVKTIDFSSNLFFSFFFSYQETHFAKHKTLHFEYKTNQLWFPCCFFSFQWRGTTRCWQKSNSILVLRIDDLPSNALSIVKNQPYWRDTRTSTGSSTSSLATDIKGTTTWASVNVLRCLLWHQTQRAELMAKLSCSQQQGKHFISLASFATSSQQRFLLDLASWHWVARRTGNMERLRGWWWLHTIDTLWLIVTNLCLYFTSQV